MGECVGLLLMLPLSGGDTDKEAVPLLRILLLQIA
jgi:hypothetical protein